MIPKILKIKGLYSYQSLQEIDFDRLLDNQIFGVFGAVGSGKSSILEAITFALYGDTERLSQREKRAYNMMNLKSNELLIDFEFQNFAGNEYRFTVKGRRNSKKFEDVTLVRTAYKKEVDAWVPLESANAEHVLGGLSYENFRRTIIIPQGRFQEFLQLGDKARTDMMKELFGLERFEYYFQTTHLDKSNNEQIHLLTGQLEALKECSNEVIEQKKELVHTLQDRVEVIKKEHELLKQSFADHKSNFQKWQQQESLLNVKADLEKERAEIKALATRVTKYTFCLQHFKSHIDLIERARLQKQDLLKEIAIVETEKKQFQSELETLSQKKEKIDSQYTRMDEYKHRLNYFGYRVQLFHKRLVLKEISERLAKGDAMLASKNQSIINTRNEVAQLRQSIKAKKSSSVDAIELSEIRQWHDKNSTYLHELKKREQTIADHNGELESNRKSLLSEFEALVKSNFDNVKEASQKLTNLRKETETDLEGVQHEILQIKIYNQLEHLRSDLKEGDACPLCGSKNHLVKESDSHIKSTKLSQVNYDSLTKRMKRIDEISLKLKLFNEKEIAVEESVKSIKVETAKLLGVHKLHLEAFKWDKSKYGNLEAVSGLIKSYKEELEKLEKSELQLQELQEQEIKHIQDLDKYKDGYNRIVQKKVAEEALLDEIQLKIKETGIEEPIINAEDARNKEREVEQFIAILEKDYVAINEAYAAAKEVLLTKKSRYEALEKNMQRVTDEIDKETLKFEETLSKSSFNSLEEVMIVLDKKLDVDKENTRIRVFNQKWDRTTNELELLQEQLVDIKVLNEAELSQFENKVKEQEILVDQLNTNLVKEQTLLNDLEQQRKRKHELEKELKVYSLRGDNLGVLKKIFKGSGFVNFVSRVYLKGLCDEANKRFYKLSCNQLKLELSESNAFEIRDYMNDGKLRNIKTLSGGQTFQASLCLALALAENVQAVNKGQRSFFFLDEGFGSLDKESLYVVFETLNSLKKENRQVGVISHVEDLKEEITAHLSVVNDEDKGSIVKFNWT